MIEMLITEKNENTEKTFTVKNIIVFDSAYELIRDAIGDLELEENYTEEVIEELKITGDDYNPARFVLLDYAYVVVCEAFCGDVSGEVMTFDEFFSETMAYIKEKCKNA